MLNKLFSLFNFNSLFHINDITHHVAQIVSIFEDEFEQDHDAKIAAVDSVIELLQQYKAKEQANVAQENNDQSSKSA